MKTKILISIFLLIRAAGYAAAEDVYLSIEEGVAAVNVAVPEIRAVTETPETKRAAETLRDTIIGDLEFIGLFKIVNPDHYKYVPRYSLDNLRFKEWRSIGADALFLCSAEFGNEILTVEGRLFDVKTKQMIAGKRYQAKISLDRKIGHALSDEILYHYTGKRGIFSSKIAFASDRSGMKSIFIMDYDGHNINRISRGGELNLTPNWSPDGEEIAYTSYKEGVPNLFIVDGNGANAHRFTGFDSLTTGGAFSPDGKKLVFTSSKDGNAEIYTVNRNGGDMLRLTSHSAIDSSPCWSSNGREIAFTSDRSGTPQIYVMDAEGTNVRRISRNYSYCDSPAWSPDGTAIAFTGRTKGRFQIVTYDVRTGRAQTLTSRGNNESPSWSPDGGMLCFASDRTGNWNIYLMKKDGSMQTAVTSQGNNQTPDWGS